MAFDGHVQDVKSAVGAAAAGWEGAAESAFASYAAHLIGVFSSNSEVLGRAGQLLSNLATELEHAQQVTRQAASECARYQGEMTTQQGLAQQHGQNANQLSMQASLAPHPAARSQLTGQAKAAEAQAQAAAQAAAKAEAEFKAWQKRGQDADNTYSHQADAIAREISGLEGQLKTPQLLHGGAPVPIAVSAVDRSFAAAVFPGLSQIPGSAWADNPGGALRELTGGQPVTPSQVFALYQMAQEHQSEPQGSIIDGLGGMVSSATGGLVSFGNPNTARFHGGTIAGVVVTLGIDPEALAADGERVTMGVVGGSGAVQEGDRVFRIYGQDPQSLVEGATAPDGSSMAEGARAMGRSWTREDPATMADPRARLGLPNANRGRFIIEGRIRDPTGITVEPHGARSADGQPGGGDELIIPKPSSQIEILRVRGANPPF